eukprot:2421742-Pyramimonas_sp.AAC.1
MVTGGGFMVTEPPRAQAARRGVNHRPPAELGRGKIPGFQGSRGSRSEGHTVASGNPDDEPESS